jgi:hypothetical protein
METGMAGQPHIASKNGTTWYMAKLDLFLQCFHSSTRAFLSVNTCQYAINSIARLL